MSLLQAARIGFRYQLLEPLFGDVTLDISAGDRVALVGPNGAGKTTLLRILSGNLAPDTGTLIRRRALRVALTPQTPRAVARETLEDWLNEPGLHDLESLLRHVGFDSREFGLPLNSLSAGQRTTAYLAHSLSVGADLLLLDEPTNHLDVEARRWLARHLVSSPAACVAVSHDRAFLEEFASRVFEIERGRFREYGGGYAFYEREREGREARERAEYEARQRYLAAMERAAERRLRLSRKVATTPTGQSDTRDVTAFYGGKAARLARTARLLRERTLARPDIAKPWVQESIPRLTFNNVPRGGDPPIEMIAVSKSYPGKSVLCEVSFCCRRGERWALTGANGCGKTTLLRLLLGAEQPDSGTIRVAENVRFGYYAQEAETLDPRRSPVDNCLDVCGDRQWICTLLACLKLPRVLMTQLVAKLSPGERAKSALARMLVESANVLLLDEPTNHLEVEAQRALVETLQGYPGTILLVSHDRRFVEGCASHVLNLDAHHARGAIGYDGH